MAANPLPLLSGRKDALQHCGRSDKARSSHACGGGKVAGRHGRAYLDQRDVQGRRAVEKDL